MRWNMRFYLNWKTKLFKMKTILSVILYILTVLLTYVSRVQFASEVKVVLLIFALLIASTIVSSIVLTAFYQGSFKVRLQKATLLCSVFVPLIYILGYLFFSL